MEKTATLNLRVNPLVKKQAEEVLCQLGVPMATAIDMYLKQIPLVGGIPFSVTLPKALMKNNVDINTEE
jgi:addiction module RelB/DinJ family antitoxin